MGQEEWAVLWDRAKDLEKSLPDRKRAAFSELKSRFPSLRHKHFGSLLIAVKSGRLEGDAAPLIAEYGKEFDAIEREAKRSRDESNHLITEKARLGACSSPNESARRRSRC